MTWPRPGWWRVRRSGRLAQRPVIGHVVTAIACARAVSGPTRRAAAHQALHPRPPAVAHPCERRGREVGHHAAQHRPCDNLAQQRAQHRRRRGVGRQQRREQPRRERRQRLRMQWHLCAGGGIREWVRPGAGRASSRSLRRQRPPCAAPLLGAPLRRRPHLVVAVRRGKRGVQVARLRHCNAHRRVARRCVQAAQRVAAARARHSTAACVDDRAQRVCAVAGGPWEARQGAARRRALGSGTAAHRPWVGLHMPQRYPC